VYEYLGRLLQQPFGYQSLVVWQLKQLQFAGVPELPSA
jgi:hypothetical protein